MDHNLSQTIALLARTPAALNALLCDLPDAWTLQNEGENTWSAYDVVDHLVYVERGDWIPRIKIVLEFGETQTLEPVNRRRTPERPNAKHCHNYWTSSHGNAQKI